MLAERLTRITKDKLGSEKLLESFPQIASIREIEVLYHMVNFKTEQQIADRMFISYKTVKFHKTNIFKRIGLSGTNEVLAVYWCRPTEKRIVESIKATGIVLPYNPDINL